MIKPSLSTLRRAAASALCLAGAAHAAGLEVGPEVLLDAATERRLP